MNKLISEFLQKLIFERLESEESLRPNIVLIKIVDNATMARKYRGFIPNDFPTYDPYKDSNSCKPYMLPLANAAIANNDTEMLSMILELSFAWGETQEGIDFWDSVYKTLRDQKPNPVLVNLCPLSYLSFVG